MLKSILMGSAAALMVAGGVAVAKPGGMMGKADADGDGNLTRAEVTAATASGFARMDVNGDGVLNKDDREARKAERFAAIDVNNDGEITQAEMQAHREKRKSERQAKRDERWASADTDNSGGLSEEELTALHEGRRGGDRGGKWGKRGHRGQHGRMGMHMMKQADTNGDNAISQAEFQTAALARFDKADADSNGVVTKEERRAAWKAMREKRSEMRDN